MSSKYDHFYLIELQYLGFRYHGWQKQGKLKTIQLMLSKTISFVWPHTWKILAAGRTDAKVSARSTYFELFTKEEINTNEFKLEMNKNLPADIALLDIKKVDSSFNVIQDVEEKIYQYYFSYGIEKYPLSASLISHFYGYLDLNSMKEGAKIFQGTHDFSEFSKDISDKGKRLRTINSSFIKSNNELKANFFPPETYIFEVKGKGFARHQIRLMMGALVLIGRGELGLEELKRSLNGEEVGIYKYLAPASGLMVKSIFYRGADGDKTS